MVNDSNNTAGDNKGFPLKSWLILYLKATPKNRDYYTILRDLYCWLGPIDLPDIDNYKEIHPTFASLYIKDIAGRLGTEPKVIWHTLIEIYGYNQG